MRGEEVPEMKEEEGLDVDIILVVISAENVPVLSTKFTKKLT